MQYLLLADVATVASFQLGEDDRGQDRESTKNEECLRDASDHLWWVGMSATGNEKCCGQPADATPKPMDICCMLAMELALLVSSSVMSA